MQYVAMVKTENKHYVLLGDDMSVVGFSSLARGIAYFEGAYNSNHSRGYEKSMSACLNFIAFQPKVVAIRDTSDLAKRVVGGTQFYPTSLSHVSGHYNAIECNGAGSEEAYNAGETPSLITV